MTRYEYDEDASAKYHMDVVHESAPFTMRSAQEALQWLIKSRAVRFDTDGLKIDRDPKRSAGWLDTDDVTELLEVLGVPKSEISIGAMDRDYESTSFEVRVGHAGVEVLARMNPTLQARLSKFRDAHPGNG